MAKKEDTYLNFQELQEFKKELDKAYKLKAGNRVEITADNVINVTGGGSAETGSTLYVRDTTTGHEFEGCTVKVKLTYSAAGFTEERSGVFKNGVCEIVVNNIGTFEVSTTLEGDTYSSSVSVTAYSFYVINLARTQSTISVYIQDSELLNETIVATHNVTKKEYTKSITKIDSYFDIKVNETGMYTVTIK